MIPVLIAAIVTGCATAALVALQPHIETYTTNKRLSEAHRAFDGSPVSKEKL